MSSQTTVVPLPRHVDLDAILGVLRDHLDSVVECRIAFSLYLNPELRGMRALERSAGIGINSVLETLSSSDWGLSVHGLVQTIERGRSWDSEGREVAIYRLAESVREGVTKSLISKKGPEDQETLKLSKTRKTDGDSLPHRFSLPEVLAVLDPALDLWSRNGLVIDGVRQATLGPEAWRVAMLTGMATIEMSAKEWTELAGGADKAKRLAKKMTDFGWGILTKTGRARATRYTLDWSMILDDQYDLLLMRKREGKLLNEHAEEQRRITEPLSAEEIRATKGKQLAKDLLDALDGSETPEHRAAVEHLAEVYKNATPADWARWHERSPVSV